MMILPPKPVISPELQRWGLRAIALVLGGVSTLLLTQQPITFSSVLAVIVAALGGQSLGTTTLGPGHIDEAALPKSWRDSGAPKSGPEGGNA